MHRFPWRWPSSFSWLGGWLGLVSWSVAAERPVDFNRDVRPILSEYCFACHGFDEHGRQADLRLDQAESALADRGGNFAIVPGKVEQSEVWRRIVSQDPEEVMPPPKAHEPLAEADKAILRRWIEEGAVYAGHWSFIPPQQMAVAGIQRASQAIDHFVKQRLAEEGWELSPSADKATLYRRLSLDLTGLPPSGQEVQAFLADDSEDAYEKAVDRFLSQPHFGERLALDWMDAARYADTNGFSIDGGRHLWLWRDWVIQAFNDNLPYDRFLLEQVAGDLLPNATDAQKIATGFQRNNMVTHEGGTIPAENLTNYNADRVKTFGEAILGLTLACAQCHDHKFDPISQREYYQLFAYFNTLSDQGLDGNAGVNPAPSITTHTVLKTEERGELAARIAAIETSLAKVQPTILEAWESRQQRRLAARGRQLQTYPVRVLKISTPNRGAGFEIEDEQRVRLNAPGAMGAFDISVELPAMEQPMTGLRVIFYPVAELPGGGWGYGPDTSNARTRRTPPAKSTAKANAAGEKPAGDGTATSAPAAKGTFMLTALAATVDRLAGDQVNLFKLQRFAQVTANSWDPQHPAAGCLDPRNESGWSPNPESEGPVHLTATLAEAVDSRQTPFMTVQLNFGHGRSLIPQLMEIQAITGTDDGTDLSEEILELLRVPSAARSQDQLQQLWQYCAAQAEELSSLRTELGNLRERLSVLSDSFTTMVMDVAAKPRETFILTRGDYAQPGEKVTAGTPAVLPSLPAGSSQDRLGLGQWLIAREHPLTARVAVNRFWRLFFGTGLVGTAADFGSQGEWPSHPELLDWLAVDFIESGWDVKALLKQIVTSETYRQSSKASNEQLERDPQNRWLGRGSRFRLPAELVRDAALKTSGLLVPRIGGPSVNPYMPGDLWREVSHYGSTPATSQTFVQDHGEKLYRRSLYTYWKRTAPPPNMLAFDAPNREVCTIARGNTTTPLQALVTLNDVQFVEAARVFAARILAQGGQDDEQRLAWAFLEATSRPIGDDEGAVLQRTLRRALQHFAEHPGSAEALLSVGEFPLPENYRSAELAAWTELASLLLNLSESLTRS
jgi:hypothetical protein